MPLTEFQAELARLLATNRSEDSYLAGGAAIHFEPDTKRYSNDLDYFHDSVERVATAFQADRELLQEHGYEVSIDMHQPGYIRTTVRNPQGMTKVEWAHDSAWRFMPTVYDPECGYKLHPIDLAVNKVLTLAGRDEPRDFLDIIHLHETVLSLGAMCWAAVGKDPGYNPRSLLELLRRRGKYRPEDFSPLHLKEPIDLTRLKTKWLDMLDSAEQFIRSRPAEEIGCLYHSRSRKKFVEPTADDGDDVLPHYGRPGGIIPTI